MTESGRSGRPDPADVTERVERALADAEIARDALFDDLAALGALDVRVSDGTASVTVTLPIPSRDLRRVVEGEVRAAVRPVDGVTRVECRFVPAVPDPGTDVDLIPDVKAVVAVSSGKGGVGKSTVAVNLAASLAAAGASVGLVDVDVYGPNAPAMLGLEERKPDTTADDLMVPREAHGVAAMSMGFVVEADDPVIWRGPLVDEFVKQLFGDVEWGTLDYLFVDMPPGTGDAQLSLVQHLPVTGAVVVTTPQAVAVDDARRGLRGFARYDVPILGVVENMTSFECPDCGGEHDLFGAGGADRLAAEHDVPVLGRIPLDPAVGTLDGADDAGDPPGVSVPGIGRIGLPRTRRERERPTSLPPISVRDGGGDARTRTELLATRTAARVRRVVADRVADDGRPSTAG